MGPSIKVISAIWKHYNVDLTSELLSLCDVIAFYLGSQNWKIKTGEGWEKKITGGNTGRDN